MSASLANATGIEQGSESGIGTGLGGLGRIGGSLGMEGEGGGGGGGGAVKAAVEAGLVAPWEAVVGGFVLTVLFIAGFFLLKENPRLTNDSPEIIRQRIAYVTVISTVSVGLVYALFNHRGVLDYEPFHVWVGVRLPGLLAAAVLPLAQMLVLFAGPLLMAFFDGDLPLQQNFRFEDVQEAFATPIGIRNHIAAPIAEELVFRALCASLMVLAGFGRRTIILACPLFFGLAHVHRVRDLYRRSMLYGKRDDHLRTAILQTAVQTVYTTVFGWYCTFVLLRTGHLLGPILCHMFANLMGVPPFDRAIGHRRQFWIVPMFVVGLAGFFFILFPLTDPAFFSNPLWDALKP